MDAFIFQSHLSSCQTVVESTTCLEILHYSDHIHNGCKERSADGDLLDFLDRKGDFAEPPPRYTASVTSGLRLVVQGQAKNAETFAPSMISLPREQYAAMIEKLGLPRRAIEGTTVVGPFFWTSFVESENDRRLHIIFRKSDTRRHGKTEGWEIILSYCPQTCMTTGFVKGTPTAQMTRILEDLKSFVAKDQSIHPLLLPVLVLDQSLGTERDVQLRDARDRVRSLEQSISQRRDGPIVGKGREPVQETMSDIEATNRALVECHAQVLRKRPQDWLEIIRGVEAAMNAVQEATVPELWTPQMESVHRSLAGRLEFYKIKLKAVEGYAHTTLQRLNIQRDALTSVIAHRESIVNLQMVAMITDQRRISQAAKRDGNALKRLSMMGALFLPGTFLASVFSMVFFRVPDQEAFSGLEVAPQLWIYFSIAIPLTIIAVGTMWIWGRKGSRKSKKLTAAMEEGVERMEREIALELQRQNFGRGHMDANLERKNSLDDF